MFERLRGGLTFANVTSVLALVFAMGGGAYAVTSIPGPGGVIHGCYQKRTGSLRIVPASKRCAGSEKAIRWNQKGAQGAPGTAGTPGTPGLQGQQGPKGDTGSPGADGAAGTARAYGLVSGTSVTRSKNIAGVTNGSPGIFCVALAGGIDATTTGPELSLDHATDATTSGDNQPQAFAEYRSDAADCPAGGIDVITGYRSETVGGGGSVTDVKITYADQDFFIAVP